MVTTATERLSRRSAVIENVDSKSRTATAVVTTDAPVPMFDPKRWEVVPEVLLSEGMTVRTGDTVPLLDNHQRDSITSILGSAGGFIPNGGETRSSITFADTPEGQRAFDLYDQKHLRGVSIGYQVLDKVYVPKGKSEQINGRTFTGPVNVARAWELHEVSVTPVAADKNAGFRSLNTEEETAMEGLRELLTEIGLPEDASPEQARTLLQGLKRGSDSFTLIQAAEKRNFNIEEALDIATRANSKEAGLDMITDRLSQRDHVNPRYVAGPSEADKLQGEFGGLLQAKSLRSCGYTDDQTRDALKKTGITEPQSPLRNAPLSEIAREWCEAAGYDVRGLGKDVVAKIALGFGDQLGIQSRSGGYGYHNTGMFSSLMLNASNKSLLEGYMTYPTTWRQIGIQGESVPDFKPVHRIRLGNVDNIEVWPGNKAPNELAIVDEKESYAVEARSNSISFDWKSIVNDDMGGLGRVPFELGMAATRTVNAVFWEQITSNPNLQDGVALFATATGARKKDNYTASGGAPSVAQLTTGKKLMRTQVGTNTREGAASSVVLGVEPRFLVGPAALETTIDQLINSTADPAATQSGVANPFRNLVPIIEPLLDASSATAWYLFADPRFFPTVELSFLMGQETPQIRNWREDSTLSLHYAILQTFGAKAIDYRGAYKNAG